MNEVATQLMSGDTKQLLTIALTAAVAILSQYLITKVTKKAELESINENFKQTLEQHEQLTEKSGKINHHFNREALAYQIKLSHYETKSTEAIVECYEKLISLHGVLLNFIAFDNRDNEIKGILNEMVSFRNLVIAKKIWLPLLVRDQFQDIQTELLQQVNTFARTLRVVRNILQPDDDEIDATDDTQIQFYDYIADLSNRLSHFGDQLGDTIRQIMNESPNSPHESRPTGSHTPAT